MKDLKNIEDLFKESFNDFEITPPDSVKASVDNAIKKRSSGIIWWLTVLAIALVTIPLAYYFTSNSAIEKEITTTRIISTNSSAENETVNSNNPKEELTVAFIDSNQKNKGSATEIKNNSKFSNSNKKIKAKKDLKSRITPVSKTPRSKLPKTKESSASSSQKTARPTKKTKAKKPNHYLNSDNRTDVMTSVSSDESKQTDEINSTEIGDKSKATLADESDANKSIKDSVNDTQNTSAQNSKPDDSSNKPNESGIVNGGKPKPNNSAKNWFASVYVGPQFDVVKSTNEMVSMLETKPSLRYSGEINRTLVSGFGVTSGLGYFKAQDTYSRYTYQIDSVYIGIDSIPIYDQQNPDSIIGYTYIDEFGVDSTQESHQFNYVISSILVPIYLTKQFNWENNWGMLINAGVVYRRSKVIGDPIAPYGDEPKINRNSLMLTGRVHATYQWNNWMFSLGLNAGYYVKPPVEYADIKTTRFFFNPELGIHFNF